MMRESSMTPMRDEREWCLDLSSLSGFGIRRFHGKAARMATHRCRDALLGLLFLQPLGLLPELLLELEPLELLLLRVRSEVLF